MSLTSKERVLMALNHEQPDRVPVDLGGSFVTTINVAASTTSQPMVVMSLHRCMSLKLMCRYRMSARCAMK